VVVVKSSSDVVGDRVKKGNPLLCLPNTTGSRQERTQQSPQISLEVSPLYTGRKPPGRAEVSGRQYCLTPDSKRGSEV
jgi:hypothetical protein